LVLYFKSAIKFTKTYKSLEEILFHHKLIKNYLILNVKNKYWKIFLSKTMERLVTLFTNL